ncbi:MAG: bifunctional 23S rRNA (guanine(2069)-N(7))-methyltransferase RlmK/23S rRNA (guanine(2445)-N(2))-methyltransferase RlmL [Gammaproteobacteria bacterium]|nr:bifunctional 23S rRNA (guanine(2069)-N(7))-methyltransferase RlmK/23S rRNA (guanine(2445)-N(2))-methyltransferase RlmL [Gammaproteobacteria bacterium]
MNSENQHDPLDAGAQMLANRLRKNLRTIGKWARQQGHDCYRLYDADMPEFSFAIDCYGDRVHMQEYRAPDSIPQQKAALHRQQAIMAVTEVLGLDESQLILKTRQRQKGKNQYDTITTEGEDFVVTEGHARFWVNLERYLDTGLFLDHRPMRRFIFENAASKRFLNLFCYTATASVHAALGGAASSLSIDLSNTYLDWSRRNFALNNLERSKHKLIQKDCIAYLRNSSDVFDLIFLDPPTFSNSKRTDNVLDIQRDHVELIENSMRLLSPGGLLIFSTNRRRFVLELSLPGKYQVEDYTKRSIDRDFQRKSSIHQVWLLRH